MKKILKLPMLVILTASIVLSASLAETKVNKSAEQCRYDTQYIGKVNGRKTPLNLKGAKKFIRKGISGPPVVFERPNDKTQTLSPQEAKKIIFKSRKYFTWKRPWEIGWRSVDNLEVRNSLKFRIRERNFSSPDAVKNLIRCLAPIRNVDVSWALRVADCESSYYEKNVNWGGCNGWNCYGVFQQHGKYWGSRAKAFGYPKYSSLDGALNAFPNVDVSLKMAASPGYGPGHWECK